MSRILVVEDEPRIASFLEKGLRAEGFVTTVVDDGDRAVDTARDDDFDLVLLDVGLPGRDGFTVLQDLRRRGERMPVILLTARDGVPDRVRGLDAGADDYLCKPFAFEELLARVRALVRRPRGSGITAIGFGDVKIDLATQRAERAGKPLDLTAKEHALLVFFLRHPGEVLSRTRIYEHVWDDRYDGISNTLEVHVMELRRKLEARGPRLIQTLRGRGYLFGDPPGGPA